MLWLSSKVFTTLKIDTLVTIRIRGAILPNFKDRTGDVYGNLTTLYCTQRASRNPRRKTTWMCECSRGDIREYQGDNLASGNSTCCVNCRKENRIIHGEARRGSKSSNTYNSWHSMKNRCTDENCQHYGNYGGRGITYTTSWEDFVSFKADMGDCPEGYTLERMNVNGNYNKDNCKWATRSEQSYNRRKSNKNTSGVEGVSFRKDTNKWDVYINKEGLRIRGGCFENLEDAIEKRRGLEIEFYGEIKDN